MASINDAEMVKGLVLGNKNDTFVLGDVGVARKIAESSLEVARRFSDAVIKQDIETAYALCANEFRCSFSVKRFVIELRKADEQFGGKPIRALVGGWWTAQKTAEGDFGRSVFFRVTEETEGYRIAKFKQYQQ